MASITSEASEVAEDQAESDTAMARDETMTEGEALSNRNNDAGSVLQAAAVGGEPVDPAVDGSAREEQQTAPSHAGGKGSGENRSNGRSPAETKEDLARVAESLREDAKEGEKTV